MALQERYAEFPLAFGVDTGGTDTRALSIPALSIAQNVQFDEQGGVQTRLPYGAMPMGIVGGGTITEPRRVAVDGDELLLFDRTHLYSWSEAAQLWLDKGEYRAPKVTEEATFVRTDDQRVCDRCELGGVTFYTWMSLVGSTEAIYFAARDTATGAVRVAPTLVESGTFYSRLIALSTRVLFFHRSFAGDLRVHSLDPTNLVAPSSGTGSTVAAAAVFANLPPAFDVCRSTVNPANAILVYQRVTNTSYSVVRIPETATGMSTTTIARTCVQAIAVASAPSGDRLAVIRVDGSPIVRGDILVESTFADVGAATNINMGSGTPDINQLAACFRTVQDSGVFRCYAFWSINEAASSGYNCRFSFITTTGGTTAETLFQYSMAPASRAFDHDGHVYLWMAFAQTSGSAAAGFKAQLQNSYFLYRDDQTLHAKSAMHRAGGHGDRKWRLPGVQSLGSGRYAFCGEERRVIPLGDDDVQTSYSARAPLDVVVQFDSDEARRVAKLGSTLYIAGGQILQYDGEGVVEAGFHVFPYRLSPAAGAAGAVAAGTYVVKYTWRWDNARGERDRSTTATSEAVTLGSSLKVSTTGESLNPTLKLGSRSAPAVEVWRTAKNPPKGAPFFLASSNDPSAAAGDNRYIVNVPGAALAVFTDNFADATLTTKEPSPENGGVLENLAPPAASIIAATQDRLLLAGIANNPFLFQYSKLRGSAEVAAFNDILQLELPPDGGDITALAVKEETVVALRETAVYVLPNDGFNNKGEGQNYGPARVVAPDVGAVSQEAVALTPRGLLFKSLKGWYLMAGWGSPVYVGGPVSAFDGDTVQSTHVVESQHQVRIVTNNRILVWDYEANQERGGAWAEWPLSSNRGGTIWQGQHLVITGDVVRRQKATFDGTEELGIDVETAWWKLSDLLQGQAKLWHVMPLGEFRSACRLRLRMKVDYDETTYVDDVRYTPSPAVAGAPLQVRHSPSVQQGLQAVKFRLTVIDTDNDGPPPGEGLKLTSIAVRYGVMEGLYRRLPAAQIA